MDRERKRNESIMIIHLLSGFLGSGKTTTIRQACKQLIPQGIGLGVITNDQGVNIVDSRLFAYMQVPQKQVGNGCFCCNYDELDNRLKELTDTYHPNIIFAESVGTCTDIVATVMKPLIQFNNAFVTISTIVDARLLFMIGIENKKVFGEDVEYIFFKQLEEAEIIVINKSDLLNNQELLQLKEYARKKHTDKKVVFQNSLAAEGVTEWLAALNEYTPKRGELKSLEMDYDKYASGEAMLAYYDGVLEIESANNDAEHIAYGLWNGIAHAVHNNDLQVGHLKCWLNGREKISYTSTTREEMTDFNEGSIARLLINARVQTTPVILENIILEQIAYTGSAKSCTITPVEKSSFSPGYPRPVHRITD